jgi:hypothetical protein
MSTSTFGSPAVSRKLDAQGPPSAEFTGFRFDLEKHPTLDLYRIVVRQYEKGKPVEETVLGPVGNSDVEDLVAIYNALCDEPEVSPTMH